MERRTRLLLKSVLAKLTASPLPAGSAAAAVREQLLVLGLIVSFVGIVYTDAYYSAFSVKYQLLTFPATHILYQGLTATFTTPWLLALYLISAVVLQVADILASVRSRSVLSRATTVCCFVPVVLGVSYVLANTAGQRRAELDRNSATSTLPRVVNMTVDEIGTFREADGLRLLLIDSGHVIVFVPQSYAQSVPNIKRYLKGDIHELDTSP
jgi:hypothetical protein